MREVLNELADFCFAFALVVLGFGFLSFSIKFLIYALFFWWPKC